MAPHHASSSSSAALLPNDASLHALEQSVAHSVAFWPPGAHDLRHVLRVSKDVDFCRFLLGQQRHGGRNITTSSPVRNVSSGGSTTSSSPVSSVSSGGNKPNSSRVSNVTNNKPV